LLLQKPIPIHQNSLLLQKFTKTKVKLQKQKANYFDNHLTIRQKQKAINRETEIKLQKAQTLKWKLN
jgi:hypothetical protein